MAEAYEALLSDLQNSNIMANMNVTPYDYPTRTTV